MSAAFGTVDRPFARLSDRSGGGGDIGDIGFFSENPGAGYVRITDVDQRVYGSQYPQLREKLQSFLENDGTDWQVRNFISPSDTSIQTTGGYQFMGGGTVNGRDVAFFRDFRSSGADAGQHIIASCPSSADGLFNFFRAVAPLNSPANGYTFTGVEFSDSTIVLMGNWNDGNSGFDFFLRSTDAGASFQSVPLAGVTDPRPSQMRICWAGGTTWYLYHGTYGALYRSTDNCSNWTKVAQATTSLTSSAVGMVISGATVAVLLYANAPPGGGGGATEAALLISQDAGASFRQQSVGSQLNRDRLNVGLFVVGAYLVVVYRKEDGSTRAYYDVLNMAGAVVQRTFSDTTGANQSVDQGVPHFFSYDGRMFTGLPDLGLFSITEAQLLNGTRGTRLGPGYQINPSRPPMGRMAQRLIYGSAARSALLSDADQNQLVCRPSALAPIYHIVRANQGLASGRIDGKVPYLRGA